MGLLEQQNVLARLYVDAEFRSAFIADPQKCGEQNDLTSGEIEDIKLILPDEIAAFAESLYFKRLREVEKLLPLTKKMLGKNFDQLFTDFTKTFTASSVKKHLEDAYNFCKFLSVHPRLTENQTGIARFEQAKLDFYGYGKKFVLRHFGFGLDLGDVTRKRIGLWIRFGKREFVV